MEEITKPSDMDKESSKCAIDFKLLARRRRALGMERERAQRLSGQIPGTKVPEYPIDRACRFL
jgi:hypothetical protein